MGDQHGITLKSLDTDSNSAVISVVITVTSTPTDYTLYLNSPIDIDVNNDGIPDIRVTLESLSATSAVINFVSLSAAGRTHLLGMLGVGG